LLKKRIIGWPLIGRGAATEHIPFSFSFSFTFGGAERALLIYA
jgi:hypothetical protein